MGLAGRVVKWEKTESIVRISSFITYLFFISRSCAALVAHFRWPEVAHGRWPKVATGG